MTQELSEKQKQKLLADGVQVPVDNIRVSRNAIRRAKKNANRKHGSHILANELSHGHSRDMSPMYDRSESTATEYSETAQAIKMRKAAEKRARKAKQ